VCVGSKIIRVVAACQRVSDVVEDFPAFDWVE
jgi:hypothetical protein